MKLHYIFVIFFAAAHPITAIAEYYDCRLSGKDSNWIIAFQMNKTPRLEVLSHRENAPCATNSSCKKRTFDASLKGNIIKLTMESTLLKMPTYTEGFYDDIELDKKTLKIKYHLHAISVSGDSSDEWFNGLCKLN